MIETIAWNEREKPWHGLGVSVPGAMTSEEAIKLAGLDWKVNPTPMFIQNDIGTTLVPDYVANVRDKDNSVLGVVTTKYKIIQNEEAFSFMDNVIGNGCVYDTAGSLDGGKRIWVCVRLADMKVAGDDFENYIVLTTSHDGKGSIRAVVTPIRVVCQNTLSIGIQRALRSWKMNHMGNISSKIKEAEKTLDLSFKYLESLEEEAQKLLDIKIDEGKFIKILDKLYPIPQGTTGLKTRNIEKNKDELLFRFLETPDIKDFRYTGWGAVNTFSDFLSHRKPQRATQTFAEKVMSDLLTGDNLIDQARELVLAS